MTDFPDDRSPVEIARQIDHTRGEIGQTLDALEHKLAARQLVEKGIDMISDAIDEYDVLNRGVDAIRANPLPVTLIGVGAAWLLVRSSGLVGRGGGKAPAGSPTTSRNAALPTEPPGTVLTAGVADRVDADARIATGMHDFGRTGNPVVDTPLSDREGGWVHQAAGAARGAIHAARDTGDAVIEQAGAYAGKAGGRASRLADQVTDTFTRHPLLLGGVGVLAGALVASLLPATRVEDEWLGATGDRLRGAAAAASRDAVARAGDVARRSVDAAADAAYDVAKEETDRLAATPPAGHR